MSLPTFQRVPKIFGRILDGTLTGFSIAGEIEEEDTMYDGDLEKRSHHQDFTLSELSFVDVPANQFANVVSIQKSGEVTGMLLRHSLKRLLLRSR